MKDDVLSGLWEPPANTSDLRPSSNKWHEALKKIAVEDFKVAYAGSIVYIKKGSNYYLDNSNRILVGWHGTYDPPCGMDGELLLDND
ncbi:hypothetical protein [Enterococcus canis]|uniref:hypothetical protein n=1 Tax=Enterococcus canis TaxID=214095 RepID=UPI00082DD779|nr:hypothetical protein [Enterococcus canis]